MLVNEACFVLPLLILSLAPTAYSIDEDLVYKDVPEDGTLNFTEKAKKYGFKCEEHTVETKDGYLLTLFHIPGDATKPLLLVHGIADSADGFIQLNNESLSLTAPARGKDTWIASLRGSKYSRSHKTLDVEKDKKEFWDFALQEMAVYDLTAIIDYILKATGQKKLKAIAHSQGTTLFYVLGAEKPEYNEKVELFISLAPICYLHHVKEMTKVLVNTWPIISPLFEVIGLYEIFPKPFLDFKTILCSQKDIGYDICAKGVFFPIAGSDPEELEPEAFRAIVGRYPDSASVKDGNHLVQIAHRKKFSQYDYGVLENIKRYGQATPPDYALNKVTMPIVLIAAENDNLSALEDVAILRSQLPNVVKYHVMERKEFNHIDYVWGKSTPTTLYPMIYELLDNSKSTI